MTDNPDCRESDDAFVCFDSQSETDKEESELKKYSFNKQKPEFPFFESSLFMSLPVSF